MILFILRINFFSHIGLFLCLFSRIVLNYYRDNVLRPNAKPVIRCIDITSWGSIDKSSSILVNSSIVNLLFPLLSASLKRFSRFGGLLFNKLYKLIIASSSYKLSSLGTLNCYEDWAKLKLFKNTWPHFLRAAASITFKFYIYFIKS